MFQTGDIILSSKDSIIVKMLRWVSKDEVNWGHCLLVKDKNTAFEASWKLQEVSLEDVFNRKRTHKYRVIRYNKLTDRQKKVLIKSCGSLVGLNYSIKRIFLMAIDEIFRTSLSKRIKDKKMQVCSSYVAWAYYVACKTKFNGVSWLDCDPDDIEDHYLENSSDWMIVKEK